MKLLYFQENNKITYDFLSSKFIFSNDDEKKQIVQELELAHVITHFTPRRDLDDDEQPTKEEYYKFRFVGILTISSYCLIVYPKYIIDILNDTNNGHKKIIQILQVIDKFQKNSYGYGDDKKNNYIALRLEIIKEFILNGLYEKGNEFSYLNGEGQILWEKSVNELQPYIINNIPIYLDFYTIQSEIDRSDVVRRIHACIIDEIVTTLGDLLKIFKYHVSNNTDEGLEQIGTNENILYLLENELRNQFVSDKQELLNMLINYVKSKNSTSDNHIELYGTNNFNIIWENVCKKCYNNNLDLTLDKVGLISLSKQNDQNISEIIDKPNWIRITDKEIFVANDTLELDVLFVNKRKKRFEIYDAKYYCIDFIINNGKNIVKNQPGIGDITKQYLYQLAFSEIAEYNGFTFTNNFVVPIDDYDEQGNGKVFSRVSVGFLKSLELADINVIAHNPCYIYNIFLKDDKINMID